MCYATYCLLFYYFCYWLNFTVYYSLLVPVLLHLLVCTVFTLFVLFPILLNFVQFTIFTMLFNTVHLRFTVFFFTVRYCTVYTVIGNIWVSLSSTIQYLTKINQTEIRIIQNKLQIYFIAKIVLALAAGCFGTGGEDVLAPAGWMFWHWLGISS